MTGPVPAAVLALHLSQSRQRLMCCPHLQQGKVPCCTLIKPAAQTCQAAPEPEEGGGGGQAVLISTWARQLVF